MYSLALKLGRTVGELLQSMSGAELVTWFAYYEVDPWTDDRADWRNGMLCSVTANCLTGAKHEPGDFVPQYQAAETPEPDADALLLAGMKWCGMLSGAVTKV